MTHSTTPEREAIVQKLLDAIGSDHTEVVNAAELARRILERYDLLPASEGVVQPFVPGILPPDAFSYQHMMATHGISKADAKRMVQRIKTEKVWLNNLYQVNIAPVEQQDGWPPMLHVSIKRRDKAPIRDWRVLQQIKNLLVGPENEAIELYPAESRLVDTANQYHLWALSTPGNRFPIGWMERLVDGQSSGGAVQRPFPMTGVTP